MRSGLITLAIVAIVLGVVTWMDPPRQALGPAVQVQAPEPNDAAVPPPQEEEATSSSAAADPAMREHEARAAFHERVRTFFAQAPILSREEKQRTALELDEQIVEYERRRELSAAEALTLRLALIQETAPEPERLERMQALRDSYRARDEEHGGQAPDPMFELYKAREQEIVAHVASLHEIPGGLTREEYLRVRLQREREALLEDGSVD
jgi:hypothetical protein